MSIHFSSECYQRLFILATSTVAIYFTFRHNKQPFMNKALAITGVISYIYLLCRRRQRIAHDITKQRVIVLTGCDSGLGYSFAKHSLDLGFVVLAGFFNVQSEGCYKLKTLGGDCLHPFQLNLLDDDSIRAAIIFINQYFEENKTKKCHALINNAGTMVYGEFDWLTKSLIDEQLRVNVYGPMLLTHGCIPLLRRDKGRLINVGSHCAFASLPGLSIYGATKAAIHAWSDSLRVELNKFHINVIKFVPGSFITQSKIFNRLVRDRNEIEQNLTLEKKIVYNNYIDRYYGYLMMIPIPTTTCEVVDDNLYIQFERALMEKYPKALYKNEITRYKIYYFLFQISPTPVRDYLMNKFIRLPKWSPAVNNKMTVVNETFSTES